MQLAPQKEEEEEEEEETDNKILTIIGHNYFSLFLCRLFCPISIDFNLSWCIECVLEREGETERDRQRESERETETDRQTETKEERKIRKKENQCYYFRWPWTDYLS